MHFKIKKTRFLILLPAAVCFCTASIFAQDTTGNSASLQTSSNDSATVARPETSGVDTNSQQGHAVSAAQRDSSSTDTAKMPVDSNSKPVNTSLSADTSAKAADTMSQASAKASVTTDTSARFYDKPFLSIGLGWALGSLPLFDQWADGLPDSLSNMPGYDSSINALTPTITYPDAYNTAFPFSISFSPYVSKKGHLTITAGGSFISKDFNASWLNDTFSTVWNISRSMSMLTASAGCTYYYRIPAEYFSIANIERAFAVFGLHASPYVKLTDTYDGYSNVTGQSIHTEKRYKGYAFAWQAGISTFRPLSLMSAVEIGIHYTGGWYCRFMKNDHHVRWSAINSESKNKDEIVEFMTHRLFISFNLLAGKKPAPLQ